MKACPSCLLLPYRFVRWCFLVVGVAIGILIGTTLASLQFEVYKSEMRGIVNQAINKIGHAAAKETKKK